MQEKKFMVKIKRLVNRNQATQNFINKWINRLNEITDAPRLFKEASALFLLSSVVGRSIQYQTVAPTDPFKSDILPSGTLLNTWFFLIGKKRISRKKTIIHEINETLRSVDPEIQLPNFHSLRKLLRLLKQKRAGEATHATWVENEPYDIFSKRGIRKGMRRIFKNLYEGENLGKVNKKRKNSEKPWVRDKKRFLRFDRRIPRPYFTAFLASNHTLPSGFVPSGLRHGFLNRFIYIYIKQYPERQPNTPNTTETSRTLLEDIENFLTQVKRNRERGELSLLNFTVEARNLYFTFTEKVNQEIEHKDLRIREGYWAQIPEFLGKIASLHRIGRIDCNSSKWRDFSLLVKPEDVAWGITFIQQIWKHFNEVVRLTRRRLKAGAYHGRKWILRIKRILATHEGKITRSALLRRTGLTIKTFDRFINTLIERNEVQESHEDTPEKTIYAYKPPQSTNSKAD